MKILLIDDSINFTKTLSKLLPMYKCSIANTINDARRLYNNDNFDLIICDFNLRDTITGDELIEELHPKIPVIYLTGLGSKIESKNVLLKPVTREDLLEAIRENTPN